MTYDILSDIVLSVFFGFIQRAGVRDAIDYKRNKSTRRKFYKEKTIGIKLLCAYSYKESAAPRHLIVFQTMRAVNLLMFAVTVTLSFFSNTHTVCNFLFSAKLGIMLLDVLYTIFIAGIAASPGSKKMNFDLFKKP